MRLVNLSSRFICCFKVETDYGYLVVEGISIDDVIRNCNDRLGYVVGNVVDVDSCYAYLEECLF